VFRQTTRRPYVRFWLKADIRLTPVRQVFPDAIVAPGVLFGTTDTRYYQMLAENSFRFLPLRLKPDDLHRFHGTNERIALGNYTEIIQFYAQILRNI
jgi:carboxypeptidase PM20D1